MKLHWIASTSLSLVRAVQTCAAPHFHGPKTNAGVKKSLGGFALKDTGAMSQFISDSERVSERLISASVSEREFWDHLSDELISAGNDTAITPQLCEVALLRSGHSQLQSDQTAAAIHRSIDNCRRLLMTDSPRFADQLRLRYAPLKQAYEAYGPGIVRSIGKQIWSGSPPANWWPKRVTVHAVTPLHSGAAGRSSYQACVWIEAVLTDISPNVPEWLRLVYQLTQIAVDGHTRTHLTGASGTTAVLGVGGVLKSKSAKPISGKPISPNPTNTGKPTNANPVPSADVSHGTGAGDGTSGGDSKPGTELPWALGSIPVVLHQAAEAGLLSGDSLPIEQTLDLWWQSEETFMQSSLATSSSEIALDRGVPETADVLARWWEEHGRDASAFPIALKQLAKMLATPTDKKGR
ncbi:putative secreted protein [Rhodopirellula sallentina SM41]|uniref:Putative secreted protein n=1 Tax=Rhodopirellula sallentina SM41 TaxID=1263870 RepID=M5U4M7_9BACT|nr:putative secreted protein [Rhodopirellula sallentina SM41]